ncbi:MAG: hypothetical protein R6X25_04600 [Candidatus Krumholzibacteriia bacterium]
MASSRTSGGGFLVVLLLTMTLPVVAGAVCAITGEITAAPAGEQGLGDWEYTFVMQWDTGSERALLWFDILLDDLSRACSCEQIQAGVAPGDTVGYSLAKAQDATVWYFAEFLCEGDPRVPDPGKLLRIQPYPGVEPGPTGVGVFKLYSDQAPAAVEHSYLYLFDDAANFLCEGGVTGVFPGLVCDPLPAERISWSALKSVFGR